MKTNRLCIKEVFENMNIHNSDVIAEKKKIELRFKPNKKNVNKIN